MFKERIKRICYNIINFFQKKKTSFFIISNTGSTVKQFTISKGFLRLAGLCLTCILMVLGFVGYDYCHLKANYNKAELEKQVAQQSSEIVNQHKQIQKFANDINRLKSNLVELNDFEKKIRIMANIQKPTEEDSLFGVGGSIPEDLDTQSPAIENHNSLEREMHAQTRQLTLASINQKNVLKSLYKDIEKQRNLLSSTPSIRPAKGWISSGFGYRTSPFTGLREFHRGLDIANTKGTKIVATADGIVTFTGKNGLLGKTIKIDHGHGMATRYGHLSKILKKRGQAVKRGDVIAVMGNSGRSTGPHLHYEVFLNGIPVNPKKYILN